MCSPSEWEGFHLCSCDNRYAPGRNGVVDSPAGNCVSHWAEAKPDTYIIVYVNIYHIIYDTTGKGKLAIISKDGKG